MFRVCSDITCYENNKAGRKRDVRSFEKPQQGPLLTWPLPVSPAVVSSLVLAGCLPELSCRDACVQPCIVSSDLRTEFAAHL